jgi:hypothetical protein
MHSVRDGWVIVCYIHQDNALPLMVNNMWEKDTLFLLFEEDFRFDPHDMEPQVAHTEKGLVEVVGDQSTLPMPAAAVGDGEVAAKPPNRGQGRWYELPRLESDHSAFVSADTKLHDIMKYATQAHRSRVGDVVWMCWQPGGAGSKPRRTESPSSGSMFIMMTVNGAQLVKGAMDSGLLPMGHFDLKLLSWMQNLPPNELRCSYLLPPMGNYTEHVSGCEKAFAADGSVRRSCWAESWCCQGTRKREDDKHRDKWFCAFTKTGHALQVSQMPDLDILAVDALQWRTFWDVPGVPRPVANMRCAEVQEQPHAPLPAGISSTAATMSAGAASQRSKRKKRAQLFYHCLRRWTEDSVKAW